MTGTVTAPHILTEIASTRDDNRRRELLRKACDLFEVASAGLTEHETELFDEVLDLLSKKVDEGLRAEVSERVSGSGVKLDRTYTRFALDEKIEIAGPVLQKVEHLSDETLVQVARTRGQHHMAAIAVRPTLNPSVTDTLVELGDDTVLHSVASNSGARFSEPGMTKLADRSVGNTRLQAAISDRRDLTPAAVEKLISVATDEIREKLKDKSQHAAMLVEKARAALEARLGIDRIDFVAAERKVRRLARNSPANESLALTFA
ncbi:MAG: DUF2336 domain-containing protein [Rhodobiaceae bacterium]|nr:DUF2336 domain-containing protein [Rhodobiaceae bacterium]